MKGMQEAFDNKVPVVFQTLKSYIPVDQRIVYHSGIVAFVDEILYKTLFDSKCRTFPKFIEENNLYVGISQKFSALSEAKKQYQYALDALEIGRKRNSHCACFDDCVMPIISNLIYPFSSSQTAASNLFVFFLANRKLLLLLFFARTIVSIPRFLQWLIQNNSATKGTMSLFCFGACQAF
ncbi:hypothetical protein DEAC_c36810 [Desulfosporosinus acididurans]|uniref:Uncharacterized protein n=1 Tax=Desulfosporosinus acididurans TaxID=476652 RepID=A0A0J1FLT1_9FIRM|nr:hypothetical protein [Desulfosporosinus acididurans]KLU64479.1 hypothetical protein DEAC_c36810 [Desulfosporosinus acididurans]